MYQRIGTDVRSSLIRLSIQRARQGERTLYLAPSREVIFAVRRQIESDLGGLLHIQVGGMEDLEELLLSGSIRWNAPVDLSVSVGLVSAILLDLQQQGEAPLFAASIEKEGLARLMYHQIKQIKRNNILPDAMGSILASAGQDDPTQAWAVLHRVYAAYQKLLEKGRMTDVDDRSMAAARAADVDIRKLPHLLILDGFINMDPVHRDMLNNLMEKHPALDCAAGIPFYTESADPFISREIIRDLDFMGWQRKEPEPELPVIPQIAEDLALNLFDMDAPRASDPGMLDIVDAPCMADEVRQILHRVRTLLMDSHVPPERIALVIGDMTGYQPYLTDLAEEMAIPLDYTPMEPLRSSYLVKDVMRTLQARLTVGAESKLDSGGFSIFESAWGSEDWASVWPLCTSVGSFCQLLKGSLDSVPIMDDLCSLQQEGSMDEDRLYREMKALQIFVGLLERIISTGRILGDNREITRENWLDILLMEIDRQSLPGIRSAGGVKVVDPDWVRGVSYDHVFCLGLNDGVFPRLQEPDFFSRFGGETLRELRRPGPSWELDREKIRFLMMIASAARSLTFSYRTANEDGSFFLPSPFLQDAADYLQRSLITTRTMRDRFHIHPHQIHSRKEAVRYGILQQKCLDDSKKSLLESQGWDDLLPAESRKKIIRAAVMEEERFSNHPPGLYDGSIRMMDLAQKDSLYPFSASQLNDFNKCPFLYLAKRILGLQPLDEEEEMTPMYLGNLYHGILADYLGTYPRERTLNLSYLNESIQRQLDKMEEFQYSELFLQAKGEEIRDNLQSFLADDLAYRLEFEGITGNMLVPTFLEWPLDTTDIMDGCRFRANIDRVDLEFASGVPTGRYVLYDYKTKRIQIASDILKGDDLQLPLYALLADHALKKELGQEKAECLGVFFYSITKREKKGLYRDDWRKALGMKSRGIHPIQWGLLMDAFQDRIRRVVEQIRSGECTLPRHCPFANPFSSFGCDYETMCRYQPERMLSKERGPFHDS